MKKFIIYLLTLSFIFVIFSCSKKEGPNMNPGMWEIKVKMKIPNLPAGIPIPNTTFTSKMCFKENEGVIENVIKKVNDQKDCTVVKNDISGDTTDFEYKCKEADGETTIKGHFDYMGDTFKGTMAIIDPKGQKVEQEISGKKIGECK